MTSAGKTHSQGAVKAARELGDQLRLVGPGTLDWMVQIIEQSTHAGEMAELLHQLRSCDPPKEMQWAKDYAERLLAELERES